MKYKTILFVIILVSLEISGVQAAGINMDYLPNNTLKLHPGESEIYGIRIPNTGNESISVKFIVESTGNIAEIIEPNDIYVIPPQKLDTAVNIKITMPEDSKSGTKYNVELYVAEANVEEGQVVFTGSVKTGFVVEAIGNEEAQTKIDRISGFAASSPSPIPIEIIIIIIAAGPIALIAYLKFGRRRKI